MKRQSAIKSAVLIFLFFLSSCGGSSGGGGPDSYTLSGDLSGLTTGSVEISNNQEAPIVLTENGTFSITADSGSDYSLAIVINPIEQLCHITNGSDTNLQANVTDITITCESVSVAVSCTGSADSDGDTLTDCTEINTWGTNPWLQDTDGDSYLDNDEVAIFNPTNNNFISNPRIADMATIAVDLASLPYLEMIYSSSTTTSQTISTSHGTGTGSSISHDYGGENSQQLEIGHTDSLQNTTTAGVEVEIKKEGGVSFSLQNSLSIGFENAINETTGSVVNWSASEEQANSITYEESLTASQEAGFNYTNGTLEVIAKVRNSGHIPYDLENLTLTAFLFNPQHPFDLVPIENLLYSGGEFPTTTILSGESPPLNFSTNISIQKYQRLVRDSNNIVIMPATYRLLDADNSSLLLVDEDVSLSTAAITIDYGIHVARQDKYRVAVNNGDGNRAISLNDALQDILGLNISQGPGDWVYGDDPFSSTTPNGLLAVGIYAMDTSTNQYWLLAHNHTINQGAERSTDFYHLLNEGYDLNDIQLRSGDKVTMVYVGDADRDGLSDRLERDYGTNGNAFDTDSDGLMDALEIYGWLTDLDPTSSPTCDVGEQVRVYSNPLLIDSDADTVSDSDEKTQCLNPSFEFTAIAGADQFVNTGEVMTLYGDVQSTLPVIATYNWLLINGPAVLDAGVLSYELEGKEPTFTVPNEVSTLIFELTVTVDGDVSTDIVRVQVQKDYLNAIYVGDPAITAPDGTEPYSIINDALSAAITTIPHKDIYIMTQAVPYSVQTIYIPDSVSLFGGYSNNWVRDVENNKTVINATISQNNQAAVDISSATTEMWFSGFNVNTDNTTSSSGDGVIAVKVNGGTSSAPSGNVHISNNIIIASNVLSGAVENPGSSYALLTNNLSLLEVRNNTLISGNGGISISGIAGVDGVDGNPGLRGTNGINFSVPGGAGGSGQPGSNGGAGGAGGNLGHLPGYPGLPGTVSLDGEAGGDGGPGGGVCGNGSIGFNGTDGLPGSSGAGGGEFNMNQTLGYTPAHGFDGTDGHDGGGGGGGGGGSNCVFLNGGGGGGGGEAGTAGTAGTAGAGGGASIAIWLDNIVTANIQNNNMTTANGGYGGNGSHGGAGSSGGTGGDYGWGGAGGNSGGELTIANGGRGGRGGHGGQSGNGGAGSGGPSIGVYVTPGQSPIIAGNIIVLGNGGDGGHYGNAGNGGHSYGIYDANTEDTIVPDVSGLNDVTFGSAGASGTGSNGGANGAPGGSGEKNW